MISNNHSSLITLLLWSCAVWAGSGGSAWAQVHIEELRVGFAPVAGGDGNYKLGKWAPARVLLRSEKQAFTGVLELSTADSDNLDAVLRRQVHIPAADTVLVRSYVKVGKDMPEIAVRVRTDQGKVAARKVFSNSRGQLPGPAYPGVQLIVTLGRPAGLEPNQFGAQPGFLRSQFRLAQLDLVRDLPSSWYGYEAVDHLVLSLPDPAVLDEMDVQVQRAIESWVRQGGHLVVCVGEFWPRLKASHSLLAQMLPGDFSGAESVEQLPELETYLDSRSQYRLNITNPLSVPRLTNLAGRALIGSPDLPLAVRGPFGLGFVTLVALDASSKPFATWEGRTPFWIKLLRLSKSLQRHNDPSGAWTRMALNDLSSHLRRQLEQFEGVVTVPFQWVAFLVFLYILLIGPVDYFLVKKVFKRMELTWVTFPTMVIGVSVAAYFAAYWLKGDQLRINKVDVLDVDQTSGALRGTSWFTLFSPQIVQYDVALEPVFAQAVPSRSVIVSWLGLAEDTIGGMGRPGGLGWFQRGYRFQADAMSLSLVGVPIQVWSSKGFTARWLGQAGPLVEADLFGRDRVTGSITNLLDTVLQDCVLVHGERVIPLGDLAPAGSTQLSQHRPEQLKGYVARRATRFSHGRRYYQNRSPDRAAADPTAIGDLIFAMMFSSSLEASGQPANDYFNDLDLSWHLELNSAILVARVATRGSKLMLNNQQATGNVHDLTFVRVVLPVSARAR